MFVQSNNKHPSNWNFDIKYEYNLARWANSQRKLYFLRFGIFSNNLDIIKDSTIDGLESLVGWSWSCNEEIRLHEHIEPNINFFCHMYNMFKSKNGEKTSHI